jgi:hypothetical protein
MSRGVLLTAALAAVFFAYFQFIAPLLPGGSSVVPLLGLVAMPATLGALAYVGFRKAPWRLAWLIASPIFVPLPTVLFMGGDPAKPGLENVIYVGIVLVMALAEGVAWLVHHFVFRRGEANVEA